MPCYPRILTIRNMTSTLIFDTRFDSKSSGCGEQYDGFVCWPPTPSGQVAKVSCSHIKVRKHYRTLHRAKNLASGENSSLVWNDESKGDSQVFGELFRSASHAVEAGSRFVRKFQENDEDTGLFIEIVLKCSGVRMLTRIADSLVGQKKPTMWSA